MNDFILMPEILDITAFFRLVVVIILKPERIMARPMAVSTGVIIMGRPQMTIVASTYRIGKTRFTLRTRMVTTNKTLTD